MRRWVVASGSGDSGGGRTEVEDRVENKPAERGTLLEEVGFYPAVSTANPSPVSRDRLLSGPAIAEEQRSVHLAPHSPAIRPHRPEGKPALTVYLLLFDDYGKGPSLCVDAAARTSERLKSLLVIEHQHHSGKRQSHELCRCFH